VDSLTQVQLTRELVDIDSTTPHEIAVGEFLDGTLRRLGYAVVRQPVQDGRFNLVATTGRPEVVLTTHFDCVPPFFSSRVEGGRLYGRGSCDAKGILVAQIAAVERLRAAGESRAGLLFVVGEERGSEGAKTANTIASGSRFIVNGEPTDNRLATATRGVYRARLRAKGKAAHSSLPHLGVSAIDKLVDALVALRRVAWPADPDMGTTFYTTGLINGGIAPNVISPEAEAEIMFRTVGSHEALRRLIEAAAGHLVTVDDVLVVPPVRLTTRPGFATEAFSFTTDIPFLDRWGAPLLLGPGSVTVAHTDEEHVEIAELHRAVDLYEKLTRDLLG
jgi:acetylornithine deacetylase